VPPNRLDRSLHATFLGMAVNAVLTACKFTAGVLGHSHALIADAAESLADILTSLIVWRALVVAAEPADREHPYGHGKAEPIAAAVIALTLCFGAVEIALRSWQELFESRHRPQAFTLYVLIFVVAVKELLFRYVSRQAVLAGNSVLATDAWHHRSDAITSLAAAAGIGIAITCGPRFAFADDAAAILAAFIIAWNAWRLLRPALDELMDAAPNAAVISQIRSVATKTPEVNAVEQCRVRKTGNQYLVDMHIEVDPQMTVQRAHEIAHHVKDQVRQAMPSVYDVLVHVEPGAKRVKK
jgi:cation diffusion facilitator family transporter